MLEVESESVFTPIATMVVMAVSVAAPVQWTFESDKPGELPSGWKTRGGSASGIYRVVSEKTATTFWPHDPTPMACNWGWLSKYGLVTTQP